MTTHGRALEVELSRLERALGEAGAAERVRQRELDRLGEALVACGDQVTAVERAGLHALLEQCERLRQESATLGRGWVASARSLGGRMGEAELLRLLIGDAPTQGADAAATGLLGAVAELVEIMKAGRGRALMLEGAAERLVATLMNELEDTEDE